MRALTKRQPRRAIDEVTAPMPIEPLEGRVLLSAYLVTSLGDSPGTVTPAGTGKFNASTLRAAIAAANAHAGYDTIGFASSAGGAINLGSALPAITDGLTLAGPGLSKLTVQRSAAATGTFSVFHVNAGVLADIYGLTISRGTGDVTDFDTPTEGGGIYNAGSISVRECSLSNNTGPLLDGGGLFNAEAGRVTLINCTFADNNAFRGGGIMNWGVITGTGCTVSGNRGGGIHSFRGDLRLRNCTIAGNSTNQDGAGIRTGVVGGKLRMDNCTVVNNVVTNADGGSAIDVQGSASFFNTIVSGNTYRFGSTSAPSDIAYRSAGVLDRASSWNLIGAEPGQFVNGMNGNKVGITNPKLGALQLNGGTTKTMAPLAGSPVIDAGDPNFNMIVPGSQSVLLDQRGFTRLTDGNGDFVGRVDIGAVELAGKIVVAKAFNGPATSLTNKDISLRYAISIANAGPAADTIVFAPSVRGTLSAYGGNPFDINADLLIDGPGASLLKVDGGGRSRVFNVNAGKVTLDGMTVSGGVATEGGGVLNKANLTLAGVTLTGNNAWTRGNAILNTGTLGMTASSVAGNAGGGDGAVYNAGTMTIVSSLIANNSSEFGSGGIMNTKSLGMYNSTVTGNQGFKAGAIECHTGSLTTFVNVTISGNRNQPASRAGSVGGVLIDSGVKAVARNTIISGNTAYVLPFPPVNSDVSGKLDPTSAYNLIGVGGGLVNGVNHNKVGITAPKLGALASNGGPTKTMALLTGSAAINAGSNALAVGADGKLLTADQRGFPRIVGGIVDIGAFEK